MSCTNCKAGLPCSETRVAGADAGDCDRPLFDAVVWPSRLREFKLRVHTDVVALDAGVSNCPSLSKAEKDSWNAFVNAWVPFYQKELPIFGLGGEWDETCAYSKQIDAWREKLAEKCENIPGVDPKGRDNKDALALADAVAGSLKAIAVIAAVGGSIYLLSASGILTLFRRR